MKRTISLGFALLFAFAGGEAFAEASNNVSGGVVTSAKAVVNATAGAVATVAAKVTEKTSTKKGKKQKKANEANPGTKKGKKGGKKAPPPAPVVPVESEEMKALKARAATLESEKQAALDAAEEAKKAAVRAQVDADKARQEKQKQQLVYDANESRRKDAEEKKQKDATIKGQTFVEFELIPGSSLKVSSAPISSVGVNSGVGYGASLSGPTWIKNIDFVLGLSKQKNSITLAGVVLGDISATTMKAGVRYRFGFKNKYDVDPFVGGGIYTTDFTESTLYNNTLKMKGSTMSGAMVEVGVRTIFYKRYSASVALAHYFGCTGYTRLETSTGGAQITTSNVCSPTNVMVSAGVSF